MPRLSLYRPLKTNDYRYLDKIISEKYQVGGLDIFVHKYIGPDVSDQSSTGDATTPTYSQSNPLYIEDLLLLENRNRKYDDNVYVLRMVYQESDVDFNLSQFGLFLNNDTKFLTVHYNDMIRFFGRKIMSGDVLEFPNLKDYNPLDSSIVKALPRYYVVQEGNYTAEGFSQTWLPHLWRIKCTPMVNAQEFQSILKQPFEPDNIWDNGNFYPSGTIVKDGNSYYQAIQDVPSGTAITNAAYWELITNPTTISDITSTRNKDLAINDAIIAQAYAEVPSSGFDTSAYYILSTYQNGEPAPSMTNLLIGEQAETPISNGYLNGYLTGDGLPPNGLPVTQGIAFPLNPSVGDYALRLDYFPNRLFRFNGIMWKLIEQDVRTNMYMKPGDDTQRSSFVNNEYTTPTHDQGNIPSRQSLSDALKPVADNGNQGGNKPLNPYPNTRPGQKTT